MDWKKLLYWTCTLLVSGMMLYTGYLYLTDEGMKGAFVRLGFPGYFRVELAIAKMVGSIALLIPVLPMSIRQFVYFGFALTFVSACIAHLSIGDGFQAIHRPLAFLSLLGISYFFREEATFSITRQP
jgi:hypothetical protein